MHDETSAPIAPPSSAKAPSWFLRAVLFPFALTRAALLVTAWYASQFAPSWTYALPNWSTRGWSWWPVRWLDVWGHYDTIWYLDLAAHGYRAPSDFIHEQSNLAFFPLYPWLMRATAWLLPIAQREPRHYFLIAVALSNALALVALAFVYLVIRDAFHDAATASRTVLYLLLFPAGFFLSCAYSESLFLALAAGTLFLAGRDRWWLAGAFGILLGLSRPTGALLMAPLAWMYYERYQGSLRRPRLDALALLGPFLGLAMHGAHLAYLTGDPGALFHAQAAWGRTFAWPWSTLFHPRAFHPFMGPLELTALLLVTALCGALFALRQLPLALTTLTLIAPILLSGTLMSGTRLLAVAFPAFAALAWFGRRPAVDRTVVVLFATTQACLFFAWSRFYWVA